MRDYLVENIRNVAILGNGGCGKTTLVEAMAFTTSLINKLGRIQDGNTLSDYDKEEIKRQISINTSIIPMEWEGCKINVLDTPGHFDFVGEREEALNAADAAVIVVDGKSGVEAGTQKAWKLCDKYNLPRLIFVTGMDDDNASYREVVSSLTELYGKKIAPFHQPIRENGKFVGYVNITKMNARRFTGIARYEEVNIPDYSYENLEKFRETLIDAVASTSDELMEKYFNEEEFTQEEIDTALRTNCCQGTIVPVTMGSGLNVHGVFMLLNDIVRYLPAPSKIKMGINSKNNDIFEGDYNNNGSFTGQVFKTISDPFMGKYSIVKVYSGTLHTENTIYNAAKSMEEKISRLYMIRGKELIEVKNIVAGDIGAIPKLNNTVTGDTLSTKAKPVLYENPTFSKPYTYMRYKVTNKGEDDKAAVALSKLMDEDVTLKVVNDTENRQLLIYGIGDQQLEIAVSKLMTKYKVQIELSKPKVAFRETITKNAKAQGKYKKQSGGHGQYGDVWMEFEPLSDKNIAYKFEEKVVGGSVPRNFFPAVEKGIEESVLKGPLAAYPVVGVKAVLVDGSSHPVDSSEMAFKMASKLAFRNAYLKAEPILLEPIGTIVIHVPESFTGDIMGDLNKRRARVLGMTPDESGNQIIAADIPISELFGYATKLCAITGGLGDYSYEFARYEHAPEHIAKKEIEERANKVDKLEN